MSRLRQHSAYPYIIRILLMALMGVLIWQMARTWRTLAYGSAGTTDLASYWTAAQLLKDGQSPYDVQKVYQLQREMGSPHEGPNSIWNPPWLLVWLYPLTLLSFRVATVLWLVINFGLILGCGTLVWHQFATPPIQQQIGMAWMASSAFVPALFTLQMGQISTIILGGVVGFLYFASRGRDFLAGVFLALTTIKPHVVYLLWIAVAWWMIREKRWAFAAGVGSLIIPSLVILSLVWADWITGYLSYMTQQPPAYLVPTIGGVLRLVFLTDSRLVQFLPTGVVGLTLACYLMIKRPILNWNTATSPLLLISITTAAYGWSFDQIVLLVPYLEIIVWMAENRTLDMKQKAPVIASLLLIAGVMVIQNHLRSNDVFYFWGPWLLGVLYLYTRINRHPLVGLGLARTGTVSHQRISSRLTGSP